ncbi:hypothetical protein RHSIM_RhsimUnG0176400 [Rhododendron simsii]|uniref:Legume lectin domain-containing protein n=1 Tax=Rhododendron simsii TaxID=118357 RepID=A0A834FUL6_RHOSS|nr:hypothetical protein RHSIM_RhsimUnG0176400 [Rhododendron simsii]
MTIFNFQILLYSLSMFFFCILLPQTNSLTFKLTNFNDPDQKVNITTFGDAYISTQGLQLTSLEGQVGKATYIDRLHLWDNSTSTRNLTDFSTHFVFVIDSEERHNIADGFTFFLAQKDSLSEGGVGMGLPVKPGTNSREPSTPFVAVEFDTFWNQFTDPDTMGQDPHVGIDVNSVVSKVTAVWYPNIPAGIQNEAWIRYDSSSFNLTVVFTSSTNTTRVQDTIHLIIDLSDYLPEWVTFGFSAATGSPWSAKTTVKSWEFSTSLEINSNVKDPVKPRSKKISIGAIVGLVVGAVVLVGGFVLVGFGFWRRSTRAKEDDEFEVEMSMENEFESASKESDVYSFVIVALEIACGRKPLDSNMPESQMRLVEWVWDLYGVGRLLEAVDAKLGSDFDERETERLMIVGLWCAHPNHNFRPKIRQAIHMLNFEAPLPTLPPKPPMLSFFPLPLNTTPNSSSSSQNHYSSYTYNTVSSKFASPSPTSSPSISLLYKE